MTKQFASKGYYTTIISPDAAEATTFSRQLKATVILGEGSNIETLKEAGAYQADVVLSLTPYDQDNLIACQIAQKEYGVPRTVALVNDPENQEVFKQLGITIAFSSTEIIANLIEQRTSSEDIKNLIPVAEGRVNITEITLRENTPTIGKTLQELPLPDGTLIACILRNDEVIVPRASTVLQQEDRLVLVSEPDQYGQLLRSLGCAE